MDYTILGRTGLTVSVAGVGTGWPSRVGLSGGGTEENAVRVLRAALEQGVTFIDTAEAYRTEEVVRRAIDGEPRESVVISTKISPREDMDEDAVVRAVDERLRLLGTDYLDICHFHAVIDADYDRLVERAYPGLLLAREAGKVRFLGITERFNADPGHEMLARALDGDLWDVFMVGFNVLNQSARQRVLARAAEKGIGVLVMFAVRLALSRRDRLVEVVGELIGRGELDADLLRRMGGSPDDPLGWVVNETDAATLVEVAYRLVRHEPGVHVTLSGTGSLEHLNENLASLQKPPLDPSVVQKLERLFARVDSVTAQ